VKCLSNQRRGRELTAKQGGGEVSTRAITVEKAGNGMIGEYRENVIGPEKWGGGGGGGGGRVGGGGGGRGGGGGGTV